MTVSACQRFFCLTANLPPIFASIAALRRGLIITKTEKKKEGKWRNETKINNFKDVV